MAQNLKDVVANLPHEPGVYLYRNAAGEIIYIGKAVDLAKRVRQYFQRDDAVGPKTAQLVSEIADIQIIPATSEFDALLLEAKLIRSYLPRYNVISRDDKSSLYVCFTLAEPLPRVLFLRKGQLKLYEDKKRNRIYGPFQSSYALKQLMRQLRSAVPYCLQKQRNGKPCFYTHIGLCDPCPSVIDRETGETKRIDSRKYRKNISRLRDIFEGRTTEVIRDYEKEMRALADRLEFEKAAVVKAHIDTMYSLSSYRYDPAVFLERGAEDIYEEELRDLLSHLTRYYPTLASLHRIECYDISQLSGTHAVGSMVVLLDGKIAQSEFRKFRIKTVRGINDFAMMKEVLTRRFGHPEWELPDFLLVDGGKGQVGAAGEVLSAYAPQLPLAGLAKRNEELILPVGSGFETLRLPLSGRGIKVVQRIRDQAHHFAITYHRKLREKALLPS
jgi:excinuclease ABC subunit C